ncbi:hypothetical protein [Streptomyces mutabilis]|uniref:hypothetical protein n=1 Tax=Streptomyces mutabilis TaxID=67332 RepID=UPI0034DF5216
MPKANQAGAWGDLWLSLGSGWADAKLRVSYYTDAGWSAYTTWDVKHDGPRVWNQLPATTLEIAIERQKRDAADAADDVPVGWLLEYSDV